MGYVAFATLSTMANPITHMTKYIDTSGSLIMVAGTKKDLAQYVPGGTRFDFLTPTYSTGTVDIGADPDTTLEGTAVADWVANGIKAGDYVHIGAASHRSAESTWFEVASVTDVERRQRSRCRV